MNFLGNTENDFIEKGGQIGAVSLGTLNSEDVDILHNSTSRININPINTIITGDLEVTGNILIDSDDVIVQNGNTFGEDMLIGTNDDYAVIIKQNGFNHINIANNQIDFCACQSKALVWDPATITGAGRLPTIEGNGRITMGNTNGVNTIYSTDTFNPLINDYDIIFNIAYASRFATNPNNVNSERLGIHFMTDQVDPYTSPINGAIFELMNNNPDPQILHDTYTTDIAPLGGAYEIKLEIRDGVGLMRLN